MTASARIVSVYGELGNIAAHNSASPVIVGAELPTDSYVVGDSVGEGPASIGVNNWPFVFYHGELKFTGSPIIAPAKAGPVESDFTCNGWLVASLENPLGRCDTD